MHTMNQPFESGKTLEKLGIDTTRKFVVVDGEDHPFFNKGDILEFVRDSTGDVSYFRNASRSYDEHPCKLSRLAYADADKTERDGYDEAIPPSELLGKHCLDQEILKQFPPLAVDPSKMLPSSKFIPGTVAKFEEPYAPQVGDRVSIEGDVGNIGEFGKVRITLTNGDTTWITKEEVPICLTLISRRPKLRLTLSQISERLGQEVEVVEE